MAGQVFDAKGAPVPQARIYGIVKREPTETPFSFAETYGDKGHSHPLYGEHFAVGDVPPGRYVIGTEIGGKRVLRRITVAPGKAHLGGLQALMFIELTDHLRCPADHDESYLVLLPDQMEGRSVRAGQLGCPVCGRTYQLTDGVLDLGGDTAEPPATTRLEPDRAHRAGGAERSRWIPRPGGRTGPPLARSRGAQPRRCTGGGESRDRDRG